MWWSHLTSSQRNISCVILIHVVITPYFISERYFLWDSYTCGDVTLLHLKEIFLVGFLYMWWCHLTSSQRNISCGIPIHVVMTSLLYLREIFLVGFLYMWWWHLYFISEKYFLWDSYTCGDNTLLHLREIFLLGSLYMWWSHLTSSQRNISCVILVHVVMTSLLYLREIFLVGLLIHVVITPYFISEKYFLCDSYTCDDDTLLHLKEIFLVWFLYMWW